MRTEEAIEPQAVRRVLVINSVLTGGGVDTQTLSQCEALLRQGLSVELALSARSPWLAKVAAIPGLKVRVLQTPRWCWPFQLCRVIRRDRIDVVHAHHGRDYWVALLARYLSLRPALVVATRHLMTPVKEKTRRLLSRHVVVIAVSDAVAGMLQARVEQTPLRVLRVHCGIDTERFSPRPEAGVAVRAAMGIPAQAWVFAVVGAVHAPDGKGQFEFVQAARQVLARHPDAHFVCAGSGEAVPALIAMAQAEGLGAHFHHRGYGTDIDDFMQAIDVLVHPAVASEALGLVILEALSCGKPVIASRLDGIPETFSDGENGLLVPPRDVPALTDAMMQLANQRQVARQMGTHGREWVRSRFSLDVLGRALVGVYREGAAKRV